MIRTAIYLIISLILAAIAATTLIGCSTKVHHQGLSQDGYHFIDNSPALPPPSHLMK